MARLLPLISAFVFTLSAAMSHAGGKAPYPPETWQMEIAFVNFPMQITCRAPKGHGTVSEKRSGRSVRYHITGFPEADLLICSVPNGKTFRFEPAFLFGVGKAKKEWPGDYFPGEVERIKIRFKYQTSGGSYGSYKGKATFYTARGKSDHIISPDDMFAAIFPERANQPPRRWKP